MSIPDVVLANVLADALAHHEASDLPSLVRAADPDGDEHWLDFQRAGEVAARALEQVGVDARGRLLFAVPVTTTAGSVAAADALREAPAAAVSPEAWQALADELNDGIELAADEVEPNLVGRVLGLARQVMPVDANRANSITAWLREFGIESPSFPASLHKLTPAQLLRILERLRMLGHATHRLDVEPTS